VIGVAACAACSDATAPRQTHQILFIRRLPEVAHTMWLEMKTGTRSSRDAGHSVRCALVV
jgi:hypothetical protein